MSQTSKCEQVEVRAAEWPALFHLKTSINDRKTT